MAAVGTRDRPARRRLLAAASELFYSDGMHATGVEAITEHAGVARKSFYNNFASKGDLELAYIEARHQDSGYTLPGYARPKARTIGCLPSSTPTSTMQVTTT